MSMKNSNKTIGNQTRDLPACSAVPQTTAPPRAPKVNVKVKIINFSLFAGLFEYYLASRDILFSCGLGRLCKGDNVGHFRPPPYK